MKDAISSYSGALVVAAGNNGNDISDPAQTFYPASFENMENMIVVAASNQDDELCGFSNYGMVVGLTAPGENVLNTSTYWSWSSESDWFNEYGYESWSGSSAAVPHVAFAAGLIKSLAPELTAAEIKSAILDNTDYCPSLDGLVQTEGRLNVYQALLSVLPADQPIVYFDDELLPDWQTIYSDADVLVSCPITTSVPGNYLITADILDDWNYYSYPESWENYIVESIDQNEFLSGSGIVELAFSEGVMMSIQWTSVVVIRIFDSGGTQLAEEICNIIWIPPVK